MSAAKRAPGRPPKPEGTAKVGMFTLRLSEDERLAIEAAAERAGKSVSQWARDALVRASHDELSAR